MPIAQSEEHSVGVVQCVPSSGYQHDWPSQLQEQIVGQFGGEVGACPSFVQDQMCSGPNAPWQPHYGQQPIPNALEMQCDQPFLVHPIYQEMPSQDALVFGHGVQEQL